MDISACLALRGQVGAGSSAAACTMRPSSRGPKNIGYQPKSGYKASPVKKNPASCGVFQRGALIFLPTRVLWAMTKKLILFRPGCGEWDSCSLT